MKIVLTPFLLQENMMKYLIKSLNVLSRFYRNLNYRYRKLIGKIAKPEALSAIAEKCKNMSPLQISDYVRSYFKYEADGIDYSKHHLVFLYDKVGDCDDYANFCAELLKNYGYDIYLISAFADYKTGHAVCIATKNGKTYGFGNWKLMEFESDDFVIVGKKISEIGFKKEAKYIIKFDTNWRITDYYEQ